MYLNAHYLRFLVPAALRLVATFSVLALCLVNSAYAQNATETSEVQRLLRSGQLDQALQRADNFLNAKPRDAQMRFLKALILTEQKRTQEAINIFQKLTEDFPELPEPYNNLAVLHAGLGQHDKARAALELAIRTDPRYATAYENLGDVYAKLASQAYDRALQLDSSNNTASSKLSLIRDLTAGVTGSSTRPVVTDPTSTQAATKPAIPTATVSPTPQPVTPVTKLEPNHSEEVLKAVRQWATDWSKKDVEAYLDAYSKDFKPTGGLTRTQWKAERRARIEGRKKIRVEIIQPTVAVTGETAKVSFRQRYQSDNLYNNSRKTLTLSRQDGRWLIVSEVTGD
jgi:tetratricopeptide (TPR) repeat protein